MLRELDFQVLDWIQQHLRMDWLDWLMPRLTALGDKGLIWVLLALCFLLRRPTRRWGIALLTGLLGSALVGNLALKPLMARPRPCWLNEEIALLVAVPRDYSFPSGHTLAGTISAVVMLCLHRPTGLVLLALALSIAFSRLYLYVHFPTDVLGGLALGVLIGLGTVALCRRVIFPRLGAYTEE